MADEPAEVVRAFHVHVQRHRHCGADGRDLRQRQIGRQVESVSTKAYDDCESNDAVYCVAAPAYDCSGTMVAAMSISVPNIRWDKARRTEWTELVRTGASALAKRLGHA